MTTQKRVLILGGTGNGWKLAALATTIPGLEVINSLAGRTRQPLIKSTHTRIGSFGGAPGLTEYLQAQKIDLLIDATHPFAVQISWNAAIATSELNIPHLMLISPAWETTEGDRWVEVENNEAVIAILPKLAQRVFLSIGRQELASYAHLQNLWFLMRTIDQPQLNTLLPPGKLLTKRGPFSLLEERSLLQKYNIEAVVSKNSGGDATYAKIVAARELGIPVVMIQRPPLPNRKQVTDVESAVSWLRNYSD